MPASSLNLCFFWHMHQPDYRDDKGVMTMPWVFLHAIKDYYEMPWLLSRYPGLKATFNITSTLIEQINLYDEPLKNDYFLSLWERHPSDLKPQERAWLIKTCKSTQYETMIRPMANLDRLYHKEELSDDELIDFELLFMLAWCGNALRSENSLVKSLMKKEEGFGQSDKSKLLTILCDFIGTILPFYAQLHKEGVISLSTTPYSHPILPLLLDVENAKHANIHTVLPDNPISLKEDAVLQVERAIALYEKTFSSRPSGFWPAEGAVDEQSVALYKDQGIRWIATDEAILFRSIEETTRASLYNPYRYKGMTIGFRDHELSDLIGFTYRFKAAHEATEHFMHNLERISKTQKEPTLFVILDGENAWEFFENNAYDFFTSIYARLSKTSWCTTVSMDEVSEMKNQRELKTLAPGSWIYGDFSTWSGHPEKNRAWEFIYQTRRDVDNYSAEIPLEAAEKIRSHFLAAECSDWFWWYGDDHVTEFAFEFDALFREHLLSVYRLLEMQPPSDLFEPIISHKSSVSFLLKPYASISPHIDGKVSSFFKWLGSGCVDEEKLYSTMERERGPVKKIYYGHDEEKVYLAFEGEISSFEEEDLQLHITLEETGSQLSFSLQRPFMDKKSQLAIGERVELALSHSHFKGHNTLHLRFEIVQGKRIIQTMPGYGSLFVDLDETYANNWFV